MRPRNTSSREQGFTLIELLVVIIIIGILAAIAIPVFLNQRQRAHEATAKQEVRAISRSMETYRLTNDVFPSTVPQLQDVLKEAGVYDKMSGSSSQQSRGVFCITADRKAFAFVYWNPIIKSAGTGSAASRGEKTIVSTSERGVEQMPIVHYASAPSTSASLCAEAGKKLPNYDESYWMATDAQGKSAFWSTSL